MSEHTLQERIDLLNAEARTIIARIHHDYGPYQRGAPEQENRLDDIAWEIEALEEELAGSLT